MKEVKAILADKGLHLAPPPASANVSTLGLSKRALRVLDEAGIHIIKDLTSRTEGELIKLLDFRRQYFNEIKTSLIERGLNFMTSSIISQVESLDISFRVSNLLYSAGIRSIKDLISKTEEELMEIPRFGRRSLEEVKVALFERGLSLADSVGPLSLGS